ncbi:MAG: cation:proton antiporter [Planctomycetes bacterium]|nr:cation:proton antiporter [Planctomycetota bacterium]
MEHLLIDIGTVVVAATALGLVAHWLRQPVILAFLVAGALLGPGIGFGWVQDRGSIEVIGSIGLVLLLFVIGLELDLRQVLASGRQLLVTGLGQFPLCAGLGLLVFPLMGFGLATGRLEALYLGIACALSSTAIVVKALADKAELDTVAGRLTVGVLVLQDVFAILVLGFQPNFSDPKPWPLAKALLSTVVLLAVGWTVARYLLGRVFASVSRSTELVVAVSIAWCALMAGIAHHLGLSKEMGALVAGLAIAAFPYRLHVTAKTLPLRDFFLTLFFVSLGMGIPAPAWGMVAPVAGVVAVAVLSRFLTVWPLVVWSGGGHRAAVITSINLAQISEFGLVIAALGVQFGHIGGHITGILTYAMAITAVLSSYGMRWNDRIFAWGERLWRRGGEVSGLHAAISHGPGAGAHPVAILGFHRIGRAIADGLAPHLRQHLLVIDFHLETLERLRGEGIAGHFGDIGSLDTLHHAHVEHARVIVSSVPDLLLKGTDNLTLARTCRALAPKAYLIATADTPEARARLEAEGVDLVVMPWELAGERMAQAVAKALGAEPPQR